MASVMITDPTEKKLKAILFRLLCPTALELGEFELGILEKPRQDEIASHVETCPHCQQDLVQIGRAMSMPLAGEEHRSQLSEQVSRLSQRLKIFVIDLLSPPPGAVLPSPPQLAVRGQSEEMETQVYQVDSYMIAVSIERDSTQLGKYNLVGDISAMEEMEDVDAWQAHLWQGGVQLQTVSLQDAGDFVFMGVPSSDQPYELIITSPTIEVHLQQLHIPGRTANQD
jgi:hypothetical protein